MSHPADKMAGMCGMCEGQNLDQVVHGLLESIDRCGWAIQGVDGKLGHEWAYTIGLMDRFDHPELVLLGKRVPRAARFLNGCAELIKRGDRLLPGEIVAVGVSPLETITTRLVTVGSVHLERGLMTMWHEVYEALGRSPGPLVALHAAVIDANYCECHQPSAGWLDDPASTFG